ncbi:MAG: flagellar basal body rod protein FlgB [Planctomycetota bacterium]
MLVDDRMLNLARLLDVATLRARVHAENIAHQNTPGYRARAVRFADEFARVQALRGDAAARTVEPEVIEPRTTAVDNDGNDVSVDREVTLAAKNAMRYNACISLLRGKHQLLNMSINGRRS